MTAKRKAKILGVHPDHFTAARQRAKMLKPDIYPTVAMDDGSYWFHPRSKRSDAAPPELVELMKRFWHTDEVSRATGNSANRDMYIRVLK